MQLSRFGYLKSESPGAVDYANTDCFKIGQVTLREKYGLTVPAHVGRCAHAIEEERKIWARCCRIERMAGRIQFHVVDAACIEFGEQRTKPIRMLVVNYHRSWPHGFNSERKFPSAVEVTEASRDFYQGEQARIGDPRRSLENHHWKWRSQNLGPFAIALTVRLLLLFITYRRLRTCPGRHRICSCGSACRSNSSYPY